jgi:hypothetical protein
MIKNKKWANLNKSKTKNNHEPKIEKKNNNDSQTKKATTTKSNNKRSNKKPQYIK